MFTSIDHEKFRALRIAHLATRFEELITDEANDELTPEQVFLTAVDDALDQRRAHRVEKLMAIDPLSLHSHEEGPGSHLPRIVSQIGNGHALVSVPFQHTEAPMQRTDQFIECHIRIQGRPWPT